MVYKHKGIQAGMESKVTQGLLADDGGSIFGGGLVTLWSEIAAAKGQRSMSGLFAVVHRKALLWNAKGCMCAG